jgi:hypothetical protein
MECAPNKYISDKIAGIDPNNSEATSVLNSYEIKFWQEKLVCSQEKAPGQEGFDLKNNRCCRETGNTVSIGTFLDQSSFLSTDTTLPIFHNDLVPGTQAPLSSANRNSRNATIADLLEEGTPPLTGARSDSCNGDAAGCRDVSVLFNQYKTFSAMAERTCCTGNWVRNFHKERNGGGHKWGPSKMQHIRKESFKCVNWQQCTPGSSCGTNFTCDHTDEPDDPACLARSISTAEASNYFGWTNSLELLGIPQIVVKSRSFPEVNCLVDPLSQSNSGDGILPPDIIAAPISDAEFSDASTRELYSAADISNFESTIKPIFSEDEISCCQPLGTNVGTSADANLCCSGFVGPGGLCQMPDYTNLTVYFNRYVSSGAKGLSESLFDISTGFIKSPSTVEQLACQTKACASGRIARGVALSDLFVPGHENDQNKKVRRFIDGNNSANNFSGLADLYDAGLRWNDDVYCVPQGLELSSVQSCQ